MVNRQISIVRGVALWPVDKGRKVAIKSPHGGKSDGYTCFMLMLLVRSDLVCRLLGKSHLSLAIWRTPEAGHRRPISWWVCPMVTSSCG